MLHDPILTWCIVALATAGVIVRPLRWPEAVWAVAGAVALVGARAAAVAGRAGRRSATGIDVYLFLIGMMLLAELARREGLFDWLAAQRWRRRAARRTRLFALVYGVGMVVTVFLSNDATAVVLTPAVYAATRAAPAPSRCPICSSAPSSPTPRASCCRSPIPPISWSSAATCRLWPAGWRCSRCRRSRRSSSTFWRCGWRCAERSPGPIATDVERPPLTRGGKLAASGIGADALVLLAASALTCRSACRPSSAGSSTAAIVLARARSRRCRCCRAFHGACCRWSPGCSCWSRRWPDRGDRRARAACCATARSGPRRAARPGRAASSRSPPTSMNNLPAGLVAGTAVPAAHVAANRSSAALLIGVDLGPEPVGHRLAGDDPVAGGAAPRGHRGRRPGASSRSARW